MMKKETMLKLLWADDYHLIHKSKLLGKIYIWTAIALILMFIFAIIIVNRTVTDLRPVLNELITNTTNDASLDPNSKYLKISMSRLSEIPDDVLLLSMCGFALGLSTALVILSHGLYFIRFNSLIRKISPNQRVDPTPDGAGHT